jgi:transglycosylase-like protein
MQGAAFSGGLGFANSAWSAFGGQEFAPNAGWATREQQIIVAERIRASAGLGAWGCAKRL